MTRCEAAAASRGGGGVSISKVLGNAYTRDASGAIVLGDLFAEDEKDVLVELRLPKLPAPLPEGDETEGAVVLRATLSGFNVARAAPDAVAASVAVARPAATPAEQPVNAALDEQRNRILAAEAMDAASRMADAGDVEGGRRRLAQVREQVASSASADMPLSMQLQSQCLTLEENYADERRYRSVGSKMSKMQFRSHQVQRGNHASDSAAYAAGSKRKAALKSAWLSSIQSTHDSDSD